MGGDKEEDFEDLITLFFLVFCAHLERHAQKLPLLVFKVLVREHTNTKVTSQFSNTIILIPLPPIISIIVHLLNLL